MRKRTKSFLPLFAGFVVCVASAEVIPLPEPKAGGVGFTRLAAADTGIRFANQISDIRAVTNRNLLSGSGVALGDVDGDGWCDIYFCGLDNDNVLYRNRGGWKFEDVTSAAGGVACPREDGTGAVFADVDGDGDLDLLVTALGSGARLFVNDGKGRFTEKTAEAGIKSKAGSMSMTLADIDADGDLDLYVVNYRPNTLKDIPDAKFKVEYARGQPVITQFNGVPTTTPELTNRFVLSPTGDVLELGEPDQLFINDGSGKFTLSSSGRFADEDGKPLDGMYLDWGLAAIFYDFTGDGAPELYVCNDLFPPDRIWLNDGQGKFRAIPRTAIRSTSTFSMGVDFADIDRNGSVDFFVTDMRSREHVKQQVQVGEMSSLVTPPGVVDLRQQKGQNTLQLNRGDGTFAEIAWYAGVESSEWSWGPIFLDVDLDGWEDLLISNGNQYDVQNADVAAEVERLKAARRLNHQEVLGLLTRFPKLESTKLLFRNRRDHTFEDMSAQWGFSGKEISQGMALGDLDNDGDMDVVINNLFNAAAVYRNDAGAARIAVRLQGAGKNRGGAGAKLRLYGGEISLSQEMISGGRYLSGDQMMRVFGVPQGASSLEVTWRSGKKTVINDVKANHLYVVEEAAR